LLISTGQKQHQQQLQQKQQQQQQLHYKFSLPGDLLGLVAPLASFSLLSRSSFNGIVSSGGLPNIMATIK